MLFPLRKVLSQPLVHFIFIAALLFGAVGVQDKFQGERANELVITEAMLVEYLQARRGMFTADSAENVLANMSEDSYRDLVDAFVREEVLYREAQMLGMQESDYVIRRRLVQKVEYLARGFGSGDDEISEAELQDYFDSHQQRYRESQRFTFSHVFIDKDNSASELRANTLLEKINREQLGFPDALELGDRFIYHSHYVERDDDFITSHFGDAFINALRKYPADTVHWVGPLRSRYGLHLVKLLAVQPGGVPELQEVRNYVYRDALEDRISANAEQFIDELVNRYTISAPSRNELFGNQ